MGPKCPTGDGGNTTHGRGVGEGAYSFVDFTLDSHFNMTAHPFRAGAPFLPRMEPPQHASAVNVCYHIFRGVAAGAEGEVCGNNESGEHWIEEDR